MEEVAAQEMFDDDADAGEWRQRADVEVSESPGRSAQPVTPTAICRNTRTVVGKAVACAQGECCEDVDVADVPGCSARPSPAEVAATEAVQCNAMHSDAKRKGEGRMARRTSCSSHSRPHARLASLQMYDLYYVSLSLAWSSFLSSCSSSPSRRDLMSDSLAPRAPATLRVNGFPEVVRGIVRGRRSISVTNKTLEIRQTLKKGQKKCEKENVTLNHRNSILIPATHPQPSPSRRGPISQARSPALRRRSRQDSPGEI